MILLLFYLGIRVVNYWISEYRMLILVLTGSVLLGEQMSGLTLEPMSLMPNRERLLPLSESLVLGHVISFAISVKSEMLRKWLLVCDIQVWTNCGNPISKAGYHKIFPWSGLSRRNCMQRPGIRSVMHRNRKFSERMDAMDEKVSEERQEQLRSYLMGWRDGSGTAAIYNKRFIRQKGFEAALVLQEGSGTRYQRHEEWWRIELYRSIIRSNPCQGQWLLLSVVWSIVGFDKNTTVTLLQIFTNTCQARYLMAACVH